MIGPESTDKTRNGTADATTAHSLLTHSHTEDRDATPADTAPETTAQTQTDGTEEHLKRPRRRLFIIAVVVLVLLAAGLGGGYLKYASQFVSTDNAQVDGDQVAINAPATGTLTGWQITQGTQVHTDQIVGRIQINSTGPQQLIKSPGTGTVAVTNSVEGQYVTAGTNLATAYNFNDIYVTARVDETDIEAVHVGATVDISADAYPGSPISGTVEEIQDGAATNFSDFPQDNTTGNFQKVTQVIPVKIEFTNTNGLNLAPGMNVTVHIHKN